MKKTLVLLFALCLWHGNTWACVGGDFEESYYNLLTQEFIMDKQYFPFLRTPYPGFYTSNDKTSMPNENIEQWQKYLGINYDDTYQLVFKIGRDTIQGIIKGQTFDDKRLAFATPAFTAKHKQALLYLAYAKYLEPYMTIISSPSSNSWYYEPIKNVGELNYQKVINVLERSWKAETDKEMKIRYGYQLVRLAHYSTNYEDAVRFFDMYVEPLNYRPAIYYYALNQKAGAQRGLGNIDEANYNFFQVFSHSRDLKENAMTSMLFSDNIDFENMLLRAKTANERNDAYLLVGYMNFSNPLSSLKKIAVNSPDAIQAKVLMARAINQIERASLPSYVYCWDEDCASKHAHEQYPFTSDQSESSFLKQAMDVASNIANNYTTKEKDFWYISASYLHFLSKDYTKAKEYLNKINGEKNQLYASIKKSLGAYIYLAEQPQITPEVEKYIFKNYLEYFKNSYQGKEYLSTSDFTVDLLANRYYLQGDYAKSFLMNNDIFALQYNPQMKLLDEIEAFYKKPNKNEFEKFLAESRIPLITNASDKEVKIDIQSFFSDMRGTIYLAQGDLNEALESFKKVSSDFGIYRSGWDYENSKPMGYMTVKNSYNGFSGISSKIFGYNRIECFDCPESDVMALSFADDFYFIKPEMNKRELTEALIKLQEIGKKNDEKAAMANYLIGNFYYNVTITGYFRHILRYDIDNGMQWGKYNWSKPVDIYENNFYFKSYTMYYPNNLDLPEMYLTRAYSLAQNDELKAQIAFALSKWEQADFYEKLANGNSYFSSFDNENILIRDRKYFAELNKYKDTSFYQEVLSNCLYFNYYVNVSHY